ncbi:hypothetical protein [Tissierella carlieri]|uniref:hypothetical protein n=1 Tax=Tissierella carlieri TaxID=689904 RepID=UPI00210D017A|nr:hypothetical protein [Tissierella carlieri]
MVLDTSQEISSVNQNDFYSNEGDEIMLEDLIQSISATNNTLMLYEDVAITIISPVNYTYHQTYL